jgi:hypothetical protein
MENPLLSTACEHPWKPMEHSLDYRVAALLAMTKGGGLSRRQAPCRYFAPFYPAALRAGWLEALSRPSATLSPAKRGRGRQAAVIEGWSCRQSVVVAMNLPSPACGGGRPVRGGRGFRSMRSAATLISLRRGVSIARFRHCESRPPRHCEERSDVAIQFVLSGAQRR